MNECMKKVIYDGDKMITQETEQVGCGYCSFIGTETQVHKHMSLCIAYRIEGSHRKNHRRDKLIDSYTNKSMQYLDAIVDYARDNEVDLRDTIQYMQSRIDILKIYSREIKVIV